MSILENFNNDDAGRLELKDFLKTLSNIDIGGNRLYDGSGTHFMQNAEEFSKLLFILSKINDIPNKKINKFLEIGWSTGIAHTLFYKILKPNESVAVDLVVPSGMSTNTFFANLRFKNLTFIANDSKSTFTKDKLRVLGSFDFIFIDGGHDYETVKSDFNLALEIAAEKAIIALHDIHADYPAEVSRLWKDIKDSESFETLEILDINTSISYGIGLINCAGDGTLSSFNEL